MIAKLAIQMIANLAIQMIAKLVIAEVIQPSQQNPILLSTRHDINDQLRRIIRNRRKHPRRTPHPLHPHNAILMLVIKPHQSILCLVLNRGTGGDQAKQSYAAIVVCAGNELVMGVVVPGICEEIMVVFVSLEGYAAFAEIPKFDALMVAGHQIVLLIGVEVQIDDAGCCLRFDGVFLAGLRSSYLLVFLSKKRISLAFERVGISKVGSIARFEGLGKLCAILPLTVCFSKS